MTLAQSKENRPLIVVIDELDRCRPSYAVELLEVAKHLFAVDHIVFVLAVNRSELAHSIRALYGSGFDAEGYLRRFFDVDFRLPAPDRDSLSMRSSMGYGLTITSNGPPIRTSGRTAKRKLFQIC